ncbi:MAG: glutamine synthetase type III, partial [bacterium]
TGNKFEFRAVGSSASIAFPIVLLNAAVAEALGEITEQIAANMKRGKSVDDVVLGVVREAFKETSAIRFEGNNYSEEWVKEAEKRGLPNLRRSPEALDQLLTRQSRTLLTKLGIFTKAELESRFHVRLERYIKDMLIEAHTLKEIIDTLILPASFSYSGSLAASAAHAVAAGIKSTPQVAAANEIGEMIETLRERRDALDSVIGKAEHMHDDAVKQAKLLTGAVADAMASAREASDALELKVSDDVWPLPKYREMLFPV